MNLWDTCPGVPGNTPGHPGVQGWGQAQARVRGDLPGHLVAAGHGEQPLPLQHPVPRLTLALERTGWSPSPDSIFVRSCPRAFRFGCLSAGSKTETQGPLERVCRSTTYLTHQKACLTTLYQFKHSSHTRVRLFILHAPKTCAYDASTRNWTGGYNTHQIHKGGSPGGWEKRRPPL